MVLAARWQGTLIGKGMWCLPVKIIYVVDDSTLDDDVLDYRKCEYVAIGAADDATGTLKQVIQRTRELICLLLSNFRALR